MKILYTISLCFFATFVNACLVDTEPSHIRLSSTTAPATSSALEEVYPDTTTVTALDADFATEDKSPQHLLARDLKKTIGSFLRFLTDSQDEFLKMVSTCERGEASLFDTWFKGLDKTTKIQHALSLLENFRNNIIATHRWNAIITDLSHGRTTALKVFGQFVTNYTDKSKVRAVDMMHGELYPITIPSKVRDMDDMGKWYAGITIDQHAFQFMIIKQLYDHLCSIGIEQALGRFLDKRPILRGQLSGDITTPVSPDASIIDGLCAHLGPNFEFPDKVTITNLKRGPRGLWLALNLVVQRHRYGAYKHGDFIPEYKPEHKTDEPQPGIEKSTPLQPTKSRTGKKAGKKKGKKKGKGKATSKRKGGTNNKSRKPFKNQTVIKPGVGSENNAPNKQNTDGNEEATTLVSTSAASSSSADDPIHIPAPEEIVISEPEAAYIGTEEFFDEYPDSSLTTSADSHDETDEARTSESSEEAHDSALAHKIGLKKSKYTLLEDFWLAKSFSYDDFTKLFRWFGGQVHNAHGSHKKLVFTRADGSKVYGGTWRPHPSPTFRNRGLDDLRTFFSECGLEIMNYCEMQ